MCVIVTAEKGSMPTIDQLTRMSVYNDSYIRTIYAMVKRRWITNTT